MSQTEERVKEVLLHRFAELVEPCVSLIGPLADRMTHPGQVFDFAAEAPEKRLQRVKSAVDHARRHWDLWGPKERRDQAAHVEMEAMGMLLTAIAADLLVRDIHAKFRLALEDCDPCPDRELPGHGSGCPMCHGSGSKIHERGEKCSGARS